MKIAVAGLGYVGMANAVLLAQHNHVVALDIDEDRVRLVNEGHSTIVDPQISQYLADRPLDLTATTDPQRAYADAEYVVVATPTNYDPDQNYFDTSSVDSVVELVSQICPGTMVVIKSTIPVGYTITLRKQYPHMQIVFSPEFLREGKALPVSYTHLTLPTNREV